MVSSFDDASLMIPYQSIDDSSVNGAFLDNENNYELQQGPKDLPLTGALSGDAISFLSSTLPYKKEVSSDTNFPHLSGSTPSSLEQMTDFESMGINREYVDGIVNNIHDNASPNIATMNDTGQIPDFNADNPENLLSLENLTPQDIPTENVPEIAVPTPMINEQEVASLQAAPLTPYTMQPDIVPYLDIPENLTNQPAQLDLAGNVSDVDQSVNLEDYMSRNSPEASVSIAPGMTTPLPNVEYNAPVPLEQGILPDVVPDNMPESVMEDNILSTPEHQPSTVDVQPPLSEITRDVTSPANIEPFITTREPAPDIQADLNVPVPQVAIEANVVDIARPETQASIVSPPYVAPIPLSTSEVSMQESLERNGISNVVNIDNSFNNKIEQSDVFYDAQRPQLQESLNNFPMTSSDSKEINQTFNNLPESVQNPTRNFSPDQIMTSSGNTVSEIDAKEIKQLVVQNMVNDDIKGYVGEQLDKYVDGLTVDLLSQMTGLAQSISEATLKEACEGI
jgi:hypothetical protein